MDLLSETHDSTENAPYGLYQMEGHVARGNPYSYPSLRKALTALIISCFVFFVVSAYVLASQHFGDLYPIPTAVFGLYLLIHFVHFLYNARKWIDAYRQKSRL